MKSHSLHLVHGLRLALRGLRRSPGTSVGAVLTLGISLVAVAILLGVLLGARRHLPVPHGEQVVRIDVLDAHGKATAYPAGPVRAWAVGPGVAAAAGLRIEGATLSRDGVPALRASGAAMDPEAFALLDIAPRPGRLPTMDPADERSLVLGADAYEALGGDPALLGGEVRLDGVPYTVVGVMPAGFGFPEKQSYWTVLDPRQAPEQVVARLADGAGVEAAASAVEARLQRMPAPAGATGPYRARVREWTIARGEGGEAAAFAGLAVLVAVLVIICAANVSTLLLVRAAERAGPLAVHAALGASRLQVAYVLFMEALLIALGGGVVGVAGGALALRWMQLSLSQHWGYYWMRMAVQPGLVVGVLGVVLGAAVVAGTVPALRASRIDLRGVLAHSGRNSAARRWRWTGRWFVWVQVSLSTIGLVGALILGWGVHRSSGLTADLPLDRVAMGAITPGPRYLEPGARGELFADIRQALERIPGVRAAALSTAIPGMNGASSPLEILGEGSPGEQDRKAIWLAADEGVFDTYQIHPLRGRTFDDRDTRTSPAVAIVTASFAARRLGGRDPIGAQIRLDGVHADGTWAEVVGVVDDWMPEGSTGERGRVLLPLTQVSADRITLSVRTADDAAQAVGRIRTAVASVDGDLAVEGAQTLRAFTAWLLRIPRAIAWFGMLGGLTGVLVAAIGLFGVIAFQVRTRLGEIGIRMALGAARGDVLRDVLREALIRVLPGVAVGAGIAYATMGLVGYLAGGANPHSPVYYITAIGAMLLVAVLAALLPALHAARVDPLQIMRRE